MGQKAILSGFNLLNPADAVASVSADYDVASAPASNLLDGEPSSPAVISSRDPSKCFFRATRYVAADDVSLFSLVGIRPGPQAKIRVLAGSTAASPTVYSTGIAPTALEDSGNISGSAAVTRVDEDPGTPDGVIAAPDDVTADWFVRYSFPTPATTPETGYGKQVLAAWVLNSVSGIGDPATFASPTCRIDLYESGVFKATLATRQISRSEGQWVIASFDASTLSTASGAGVEALLYFTSVENGGEWKFARLDAVRWYSENSGAPAAATRDIYDSGWIDYLSDPDFEPVDTNFVITKTPAVDGVREVAFLIQDDGVRYDAPSITVDPPENETEVGVVWMGSLENGSFQPGELTPNYSPSGYSHSLNFGPIVETEGGQTGGAGKIPPVDFAVPWESLTVDEAARVFDMAERLRGVLPCLFVADPDDEFESVLNQRITTVYGVIRECRVTIGSSPTKRNVSMTIHRKR